MEIQLKFLEWLSSTATLGRVDSLNELNRNCCQGKVPVPLLGDDNFHSITLTILFDGFIFGTPDRHVVSSH